MKKILTVPPECIYPTQDNIEGNLVISKGDSIVKSEDTKYMVIELLGVGTFGQVFRCVSNEGEEVAIKVVKSINKYFQYGMNEVRILKRLRECGMTERFAVLNDAFVYKQHLCIVEEVLGVNLYELTKIFRFRGLNYITLKTFLRQILEGLHELHSQGIVHCDVKPENVLISDVLRHKVKLVDFGSSITRTLSSVFYVQSRYYRAPEVILGIPYSSSIDMWSFGCLAYELFTGRPLFPGTDNKDQIIRIHEFFSEGLPLFMLEHGENADLYFDEEAMKHMENNTNKFTQTKMIEKIYEKIGSEEDHDAFIDLLLKSLNPSYLERALPHTLLNHPFFKANVESDEYPDVARVGARPISEEVVEKNRKMSLCELNKQYFKEDIYKNTRKGSLFDPEQENRFNR